MGRHALIIGNDQYIDPKLKTLKSPSADAHALVEVLEDKSVGGFDEVMPVLNQSEHTLRREIFKFLSKKKSDDLVLVYFSGHGVLDPQGRLYLALHDTEVESLRATALPAAYVSDEMDNCSSKRKVLILDCCHSGAFSRVGLKAGEVQSVTETTFQGNGYGRVVLTASGATQFALEGDKVDENITLSLFTHYLVEGLRNGAADTARKGQISLDDWYDYAYAKVVDKTPNQVPHKWVYQQQGDLLIAKNPNVKKKIVELPADLLTLLDSHYSDVRVGAVRELGKLVRSRDNDLAELARKILEDKLNDDSDKVKVTAREELKGLDPVQNLPQISAPPQQQNISVPTPKDKPTKQQKPVVETSKPVSAPDKKTVEDKKAVVVPPVAKLKSPSQTKPKTENSDFDKSGHPTKEWIAANKITLSNGMEFMCVPAGKFIMGSDSAGFFDSFVSAEKPKHTVNIPYDYWMARFTITNEAYNTFCRAMSFPHPVDDWKNKKNHPVTHITTWRAAKAYCQWLNNELENEFPSDLNLRLPTEAEWEKSARGIDGRIYPWGDNFEKNSCNCSPGLLSSSGETLPVGSYSPRGDSPYGCADMAGNVWEWTHSLEAPYPYDIRSGREDENGIGNRVLRGGSYVNLKAQVRCSFRTPIGEEIQHNLNTFGFRTVLAPLIPK